jgi:hypothetical protein
MIWGESIQRENAQGQPSLGFPTLSILTNFPISQTVFLGESGEFRKKWMRFTLSWAWFAAALISVTHHG